MSRAKILYVETYRGPGLKIRLHLLPTLPSTSFTVVAAFVTKAGANTDRHRRAPRAGGRGAASLHLPA